MKKKITNRVSLPVESLLKEATEQTLLTVEQEVELANRIKQGDDEALMDLYNCNLRFVVSVAKQYQDRGLTMEELVEAGYLKTWYHSMFGEDVYNLTENGENLLRSLAG